MHQETRFFISYFKRTKQATEMPTFISVCIDNEGHAEFQKTTTTTTPALVGAPRSFFFHKKNDLAPAKLWQVFIKNYTISLTAVNFVIL